MARHDGQSSLQRHITAYHEAAHAVMAFQCGIPVDVIALHSSGPLLGYVRATRASLVSRVLASTRSVLAPWHLVLRDAEGYALFFLAGPVGEAKLLSTPLRAHGGESDLYKCKQLCESVLDYRNRLVRAHGASIPPIDPAELANRLRRRARAILNRPTVWRAVVALAADLEAWSTLTGHDAADTVQWTRRVRSQLSLLLPMPQRDGRNTAATARYAA